MPHVHSGHFGFTLDLCDAADRITEPAFEAGQVDMRRKHDGSTVTTTDVEVEGTLRSLIALAHPEDTVLGEEDGGQMSSSCWIIDPIDGTENFARKNPVWATLIAHMQDGELDLAAVSAPALRRRWWAARGHGAFCNGRPIHVSSVERLEDATLAFGGLHEFAPETVGSLVALAQGFRLSWGWGNFWGHMLVAEGVIDVTIEADALIWDVAAPALIVEEAGGCWSDAVGDRRLDSGLLVSGTPRLHAATIPLLRALVRDTG